MKFFIKGKHICYLVVLLIYIMPLHGNAQENLLHPGQYVSEGGRGSLTIKSGKSGLSFYLLSVGANAHTCELEGQIQNGRATLETYVKGMPCVVNFGPVKEGVRVTSTGEECRGFCGARASFEGLYIKPASKCVPVAVRKTRSEFKKFYDRKAYGAARAKLEPILRDCAKTLNWLDMGWMRNDLAITQFKLNDLEGCRQTLQPLEADAAKTDGQIMEEYPPADAESYIPVVKAARTNLKLCGTEEKGVK